MDEDEIESIYQDAFGYSPDGTTSTCIVSAEEQQKQIKKLCDENPIAKKIYELKG